MGLDPTELLCYFSSCYCRWHIVISFTVVSVDFSIAVNATFAANVALTVVVTIAVTVSIAVVVALFMSLLLSL